MSEAELFELAKLWGEGVLFPFMVLEGPIATIIGGFFVAQGVFSLWKVFLLSVIADMIGDLLFFFLGRTLGYRFVHRWGKYFGLEHSVVKRLTRYFDRHGGRIIFIVKTTTGLSWAAFTAAGIAKMSVSKFVLFSFLGGLVWSGFLVTIGFFFGESYQMIAATIKYAGVIIFATVVLVFVGIKLFGRWERNRILEQGEAM